VDLTRRDFLVGGAAAGALFIVGRAGAGTVQDGFGTSRRSRLFPGNGTVVVHSDLHNHTLLSDGATAAEDAFSIMRGVGLDVAALTDHAVFGKVGGDVACRSGPCTAYVGINEQSWQKLRQLADANHDEGNFVAMRGFEWTTGTIGHVNVWFTEQWIDAMTTMGLESPRGLSVLFESLPGPGPEVGQVLKPLVSELPETATIGPFYDWLKSAPDREVLGGGADGIAGFNHPNLYGNFESFRLDPELVARMVSCEALNGHDDYLFWGLDEGQSSPLNACLNAGWRVGMLGVSDEHEDDWADGKARGGLWVRELSRAGVREAMEARRFFATFEPGLRLDASANGVQMGQALPHRSGPVQLALDLDRGLDWYGRSLNVQVLGPGSEVPVILDSVDVTLPSWSDPVLSLTVDVDVEDARWLLLRVTDPAQPSDPRAPAEYAGLGRAVAYASPFYLEPA
jgi:hypothetical protein